MSSYIELFDLRSGNMMANFADEREAWESLRQTAAEFGLEEIAGLGLAHVEGECSRLIAMEDDLVRHVASALGQAHPERQPAATGRLAT